MSDTPELEPGQNLPAPRPPAEPAPVERFSASPSVLANELSPERAARIVRQSSNARWVGFLTVIVVILFTALYWFYEVGGPLGITEPRLDAELTAQQVTAVERGYNVFEANCARCHGVNGEGGVGPALNRQDKLFAHLNENYLRTVLATGGRYVCGNPNSLMPVWSNLSTPPGPLNYRQIDELIAYLRATNDVTYTVRDAELGTPLKDPLTGKVKTFTGWRDPKYQPAPDATPYPACWEDEFTTPSASAGASGSPGASAAPGASPSAAAPSASAGGGTGTPPISIVAQGIAFTTPSVIVPPNQGFQIAFDNEDAGVQHNVAIKDNAGTEVFKGEVFAGVATKTYDVPALDPGDYTFICSVHANMTGTMTAKE
jgi:mono/diheme cytochrome c family protein/plastocyanin